jgi:hypothetical protein
VVITTPALSIGGCRGRLALQGEIGLMRWIL